MDGALAEECLRRLICTVLRRSGFDASTPDALAELEDKVLMLVGGLLHMAHEYADLARRTRPVAFDMLQACETGGISMRSLVDTLRINAYTEKQDIDTVRFTTAQEESPTAIAMKNSTHRFLTDSEDDVVKRASYAPDHLPFLPPSHSYKRTPVYPSVATPQQALAAGIPFVDPTSADLSASTTGDGSTSADKRMSLLDERIRTTRLVEASLQNLIRATSKAGAPDPSGHAGEAQAGDAVNHDGTSVKKDEQIITLLKKYEKDAAICNFEVEWYGGARSGGAIAVSEKEQGANTGQQAAQRKRERWKY